MTEKTTAELQAEIDQLRHRIAELEQQPTLTTVENYLAARQYLTGEEHHLAAGDLLYQEGQVHPQAYLIEEGEIDIFLNIDDETIALDVRQPGQVIGELALFSDQPHLSTGQARTDCRLALIDHAAFQTFIDAPLPLTGRVLQALVSRWYKIGAILIQEVKKRQVARRELQRLNRNLEISSRSRIVLLDRMNEAFDDARIRLELALSNLNGGVFDLHYSPMAPYGTLPKRTYLAPKLKQMLGYGDKELPDDIMVWLSFMLPEDQERIQQVGRQCLDQGDEGYKVEVRMWHRDGRLRWVYHTARIIRDRAGRRVRWIGLSYDITPQKETQEQLQHRAKQLSLINQISQQIAAVLELDQLLLLTTQLIQQYFDYHHVAIFLLTGEVLQQRAVTSVYKEAIPANHTISLNEGLVGWVARHREKVVANDIAQEERYISLVAEPTMTQAELILPLQIADRLIGVLDIQSPTRHIFTPNDVMAMEALACQLATAMENARLYGSLQQQLVEREQLTGQLQESEHRHRLISELMTDYIYYARLMPDNGAIVEWITGAFEEITGYTLADINYGSDRWISHLVHPTDRPQFSQADEFIRANQPYSHEYRITTSSGQLCWLRDYMQPVWDETAGRVTHVLGAVQNITSRKQAEEKLRQQKDALAQSNASLQEFAYIASHDLQEPLRKIQAFGNRLQDRYATQLDDRGQDFLTRMISAADRGQNLIQHLLAYSRVTTHARTLVPVDLTQIIAQVVDDLALLIERSAAQVTVAELPTVTSDPVQMRQLFQNLVSNALKFQPPGRSPVVHIATLQPSTGEGSLSQAVMNMPPANYVTIIVRDNGIGFEEKYLSQIFKPFQRLHSRAEYEGSGMGLAICQKIVDRHGGRITAHSQLGQGTEFQVTLPRKLTSDE